MTPPFPMSRSEITAINAWIKARKARRGEKAVENRALMLASTPSRTLQDAPGGPHGSLNHPWPVPKPSQGKGAKQKTRKIGHLIKRGPLKASIIRLLGLLDRNKNGNACRLGRECPTKTPHPGFLAYHLVPAMRGDSTRFIEENVVWACSEANYGEVMNRSLYRQKHVDLFGKDLIERLEATAREMRQYKMSELLELRASLKSQLESAVRCGK